MNISELGEMLRMERERRGWSQADVAQKTKISILNIQAIEQGRKEALPHPVYAKGFVKNYARLLGLDEAELAEVMDKEYRVAEDDFGESPAMEKPVSMPAKSPGPKKSKLPVVLLVLLLVAVLIGLMWYSNTGRRATAPEPAVREQPIEAPAETGAGQTEPEIVETPASTPSEPESPAEESPAIVSPLEQAPAANATAEPEQPLEEPEPEPVEIEPELEPVPTPAPQPLAGGNVVTVRASELCWIYGQIDNATITDFTLRPGQSHRIRFENNLVLKLGNAGGVEVFLNGEEYEFEAQSGQVKTLTFP